MPRSGCSSAAQRAAPGADRQLGPRLPGRRLSGPEPRLAPRDGPVLRPLAARASTTASMDEPALVASGATTRRPSRSRRRWPGAGGRRAAVPAARRRASGLRLARGRGAAGRPAHRRRRRRRPTASSASAIGRRSGPAPAAVVGRRRPAERRRPRPPPGRRARSRPTRRAPLDRALEILGVPDGRPRLGVARAGRDGRRPAPGRRAGRHRRSRCSAGILNLTHRESHCGADAAGARAGRRRSAFALRDRRAIGSLPGHRIRVVGRVVDSGRSSGRRRSRRVRPPRGRRRLAARPADVPPAGGPGDLPVPAVQDDARPACARSAAVRASEPPVWRIDRGRHRRHGRPSRSSEVGESDPPRRPCDSVRRRDASR